MGKNNCNNGEFVLAKNNPLREFGLLCAIGVAVSLFVVFAIMPPMIRLRFSKGWSPSKNNSDKNLAGLKKGDFFKFLKIKRDGAKHQNNIKIVVDHI